MPQAAARPKETLSYDDVLEKVKILAGVLRHTLGVKKGDRVVIYSKTRSLMTLYSILIANVVAMVPECAIAMLACARIGAMSVHS